MVGRVSRCWDGHSRAVHSLGQYCSETAEPVTDRWFLALRDHFLSQVTYRSDFDWLHIRCPIGCNKQTPRSCRSTFCRTCYKHWIQIWVPRLCRSVTLASIVFACMAGVNKKVIVNNMPFDIWRSWGWHDNIVRFVNSNRQLAFLELFQMIPMCSS